MPDDPVSVANGDRARTLALNRPHALNSFTVEMHDALRATLEAGAHAACVRRVVMTGAGRACCAGQDLFEPAIASDLAPEATPKDIGRYLDDDCIPLATRSRSMPVPVIAAVDGVAAGAGANLALNCDIVVATRAASFVLASCRIGPSPDCGSIWLMPWLVGRARAIALSMTGAPLSAEDTERFGLIWQCVDATARTLAQRLAAMPTKALAEPRRAIGSAIELGVAAARTEESRLQCERGRAHDYLEGAAATLPKRASTFSDR